jgi:ABC-2 type transport system ATP-binding protein
MSALIEVRNIAKRYPGADKDSLQGISFDILQGERLGIFGPNGAGKTTLMSLLCGIHRASSGEVHYPTHANDLRKVLHHIGYVPQDFAFYPELTPMQNLLYFGALYGIPHKTLRTRSEALLDVLGLRAVANRKVHTFSGGMKRRVNLAIGIVHRPSILFLDEPTVGVDVQSKNAIMTYLGELNAEGTTIIYTSHHMSEGQDFCERIILLDHGQLIAVDSLDTLLTQHQQTSLEALFLQMTGTAYRD